jgi:CMP-N-acetylneuraminic acid synthetase
MNGVVYVVKRDYLMEHGRVVGEKCLPYIMEKWRSADVHDEVDLAVAEVLLHYVEPAESIEWSSGSYY